MVFQLHPVLALFGQYIIGLSICSYSLAQLIDRLLVNVQQAKFSFEVVGGNSFHHTVIQPACVSPRKDGTRLQATGKRKGKNNTIPEVLGVVDLLWCEEILDYIGEESNNYVEMLDREPEVFNR